MTLDEALHIASAEYHGVTGYSNETRITALIVFHEHADRVREAVTLTDIAKEAARLKKENEDLDAESAKLTEENCVLREALGAVMAELRELKAR